MNYKIYIPGFTYKSKGPLHIDQIQLISRYKSTDLPLYPRNVIQKDRDFIDLVFRTQSNDEYIHRIGASNDTSKLKNAEAEPEYTNSPQSGEERGIYSITLPDNFVFGDQISLEFTFYSVYNGSLLQVGKWETSYTPFGYVKIDPIRLVPGLPKQMYFNLRDWGSEEISFEWPSNAEILISTSESDYKQYIYDITQRKHIVGNTLLCNTKTKEERAQDLHGLELVSINKDGIQINCNKKEERVGWLSRGGTSQQQNLYLSDITTEFNLDDVQSYYGLKSRVNLEHFKYLYRQLPEYHISHFKDSNSLGQIIVSCIVPTQITREYPDFSSLHVTIGQVVTAQNYSPLYTTEQVFDVGTDKCYIRPKKKDSGNIKLEMSKMYGQGGDGYLSVLSTQNALSYSQGIIKKKEQSPSSLLQRSLHQESTGGYTIESKHSCKLWNIQQNTETDLLGKKVLLKYPLIEFSYGTDNKERGIKECIDVGVIKNPYYYIDLDKSNIKFNNKGSYSIIPVFTSDTEGLMPKQDDFTIINTDFYNNKLLTAGEDDCELLRCIKKGDQDIQLSTPAGLGAESTFCHEARFLNWNDFVKAGQIDLNPFTPEPNSTYCLKMTSWNVSEGLIEVIVKQGDQVVPSSLTNNRLIIQTSNNINQISITLKAKVVQVSGLPQITLPISDTPQIPQTPTKFNTNSVRYISGVGVYKVNNIPASVDKLSVDNTVVSISQVIFPVAVCLVENKQFTLNNITTKSDYRDGTELSLFEHNYTFRYLPELACYDVAGWYKVNDLGEITSIKDKNGKDMTVFQDMITQNQSILK